jgi:hypothetical protein
MVAMKCVPDDFHNGSFCRWKPHAPRWPPPQYFSILISGFINSCRCYPPATLVSALPGHATISAATPNTALPKHALPDLAKLCRCCPPATLVSAVSFFALPCIALPCPAAPRLVRPSQIVSLLSARDSRFCRAAPCAALPNTAPLGEALPSRALPRKIRHCSGWPRRKFMSLFTARDSRSCLAVARPHKAQRNNALPGPAEHSQTFLRPAMPNCPQNSCRCYPPATLVSALPRTALPKTGLT